MVAVPVFTPSRDLQGAEPPDVLARIDAFRQSGFQVEKTIYETLHVQAIEHANGAKPKESGPTKEQISEAEGDCHEGHLQFRPHGVFRTHHIGAPFFHA